MNFLAFIVAVCAATFVFGVASMIRSTKTVVARQTNEPQLQSELTEPLGRNALEALLVGLLPSRFNPNHAKNHESVTVLIKRSGYYYKTVGEFYAAAVGDFVKFLLLAVFIAGLMTMMNMMVFGVALAAVFVYAGLRAPYDRLKGLAKKRAEALHNNMMVALTVMEAMLTAGANAQTAIEKASRIGGPFCGVLSIFVKELAGNTNNADQATDEALKYLPDPNDMDAVLLLEALRQNMKGARPKFLQALRATREEVFRTIVGSTEERAAKVQSQANVFGIFAVIGILVTILLPYVIGFSM